MLRSSAMVPQRAANVAKTYTGMFDLYKPAPMLSCPACASPLRKWKGKGGPCALFVWEQGFKAPIDQPIDDDLRFSLEKRATWRLPGTFRISSSCACGVKVDAEGRCEDDTWTHTRVLVSP